MQFTSWFIDCTVVFLKKNLTFLHFFLNFSASCNDSKTSDFFRDWLAEVTNVAKKFWSFSKRMGPWISN